MTHDLFTDSPEERIAELERQNEELRQALSRLTQAVRESRPAFVAAHTALEEIGESNYKAECLLAQPREGGAQ